MGRQIRSAKGVLVDFDLIKIKEQMTDSPTPIDVQARQEHIDDRMRRRARTVKITPIEPKVELPAPTKATQPEELIDDPKDQLPEDIDGLVDIEKVEAKTKAQPRTKQKARPKPTKPNEE